MDSRDAGHLDKQWQDVLTQTFHDFRARRRRYVETHRHKIGALSGTV